MRQSAAAYNLKVAHPDLGPQSVAIEPQQLGGLDLIAFGRGKRRPD
jgi:hypothetical protein